MRLRTDSVFKLLRDGFHEKVMGSKWVPIGFQKTKFVEITGFSLYEERHPISNKNTFSKEDVSQRRPFYFVFQAGDPVVSLAPDWFCQN